MDFSRNISLYLSSVATCHPYNRALIFSAGRDPCGRALYSHLTFRQLDKLSDRYAWGLRSLGMRPGMKALLMIRPSLDFYGLVFALFKAGVVPVMIDPGMGWGNFFRCVAQVQPEAFMGIPAAHLLRRFWPGAFSLVTVSITSGGRIGSLLGGVRLASLANTNPGENFPVHESSSDQLAAVLFTSGSTGPAKGVSFTHAMFATQVEILRREYGIAPGEIDLACFPLFSLFSVALGATAAIPDMDPTRPAFVDPEKILSPINDLGVTYSFGSPTLWSRVARYCVEHGITLPSVRRVIMAGAPVPGEVHDMLLNKVLAPGAETFTPYGATESLPIANFHGSEMLRETWEKTRQGDGMCVGKPLTDNEVKIISVIEEPIANWREELILPPGQIGEICVKGTVVAKEYFNRPEATALAKIAEGEQFWHRVGDLGYFDQQGRLWFCGRKAHRVETGDKTYYSVCCEAIFNQLPGVKRSALIGFGKRPQQTPAIVIEPEQENFTQVAEQREQFLATAEAHALTRGIKEVFFCRQFPVDVRHNAKINREELVGWAAKQRPAP